METKNDCIFCKIVDKQIPAEVIFENEDFLSFLDINPRSPGHCLVIPKIHHRWVWDVEKAGQYFEIVKKIALAQKKALNTEIIYSLIHGIDIKHAHIWIYPDPKSVVGDKKDFKGNAQKIREALV